MSKFTTYNGSASQKASDAFDDAVANKPSLSNTTTTYRRWGMTSYSSSKQLGAAASKSTSSPRSKLLDEDVFSFDEDDDSSMPRGYGLTPTAAVTTTASMTVPKLRIPLTGAGKRSVRNAAGDGGAKTRRKKTRRELEKWSNLTTEQEGVMAVEDGGLKQSNTTTTAAAAAADDIFSDYESSLNDKFSSEYEAKEESPEPPVDVASSQELTQKIEYDYSDSSALSSSSSDEEEEEPTPPASDLDLDHLSNSKELEFDDPPRKMASLDAQYDFTVDSSHRRRESSLLLETLPATGDTTPVEKQPIICKIRINSKAKKISERLKVLDAIRAKRLKVDVPAKPIVRRILTHPIKVSATLARAEWSGAHRGFRAQR